MAIIFDTEKRASDYCKLMNKGARKFRYITSEYPKNQGGNGKKVIVRKIKK